MASEYKCDICGKPATVHITRIIDNQKVKVHLCSECAAKMSPNTEGLNLPEAILPAIKKLEENLFSGVSKAVKKATKVCETCGASLDAIEKGERFSCPDCYKALRSKLFSLFSEMHGATRHIGKTPKKFDSTELEEAMESDYVESITEADIEEIDQVVKEAFEQMLPNLNLSATESSLSDDTPKQKKSTKAELIKKLNEAISDERYEDAALIRDQLKDISTQ